MAGLEREDFPIGFWSMYSTASIDLRSPFSLADSPPFKTDLISGSSSFLTRLDFPDPLTPVIKV